MSASLGTRHEQRRRPVGRWSLVAWCLAQQARRDSVPDVPQLLDGARARWAHLLSTDAARACRRRHGRVVWTCPCDRSARTPPAPPPHEAQPPSIRDGHHVRSQLHNETSRAAASAAERVGRRREVARRRGVRLGISACELLPHRLAGRVAVAERHEVGKTGLRSMSCGVSDVSWTCQAGGRDQPAAASALR